MAQFFYPATENIKPNYSETARYLGYKKLDTPEEQINSLIKLCGEKMHGVLQPRGVYEIFDLDLQEQVDCSTKNGNLSDSYPRPHCMTNFEKMSDSGDGDNCMTFLQDLSFKPKIKFADLEFNSADLGRNLKDCKKVAIFAATLGPQVDAMIRKAEITSSVEATVLQATGAMYIEEVVELLNEEIKKEAAALGFKTKPRYSPGYGDVPLTMQKDFFRLLPCTRIGLSLMDTLIMAPEKSVTAFIGLF